MVAAGVVVEEEGAGEVTAPGVGYVGPVADADVEVDVVVVVVDVVVVEEAAAAHTAGTVIAPLAYRPMKSASALFVAASYATDPNLTLGVVQR